MMRIAENRRPAKHLETEDRRSNRSPLNLYIFFTKKYPFLLGRLSILVKTIYMYNWICTARQLRSVTVQ